MADEMIAAEARHIAQRKAEEDNASARTGCSRGRPHRSPEIPVCRRLALAGVVSAPACSRSPPDRKRRQAPFISACRPIRPKSRAARSRPTAAMARARNSRRKCAGASRHANENTSWSMTPLDKMLGNLTASGLHFERHHGGIPTIDPAKHSLVRSRHGGHRRRSSRWPTSSGFPSVTRKHFIECSGNGLTEWNKPTLKTVQGTHGLLSTSRMDRRAVRHLCARGRPQGRLPRGCWPKAPTRR